MNTEYLASSGRFIVVRIGISRAPGLRGWLHPLKRRRFIWKAKVYDGLVLRTVLCDDWKVIQDDWHGPKFRGTWHWQDGPREGVSSWLHEKLSRLAMAAR